jgi:hypothetical protein
MKRNTLRYALLVAALCALGSAYASDDECSGGPNGGMDATGNDCNNPAPESLIVPQTARAPTAETASAKPIGAHPSRHAVHRHVRAARSHAHPIATPTAATEELTQR